MRTLCCAFVSGLSGNEEMSLTSRLTGNFTESVCVRLCVRERLFDFRSRQFEGSVLMLGMTHISLSILHSVGALACLPSATTSQTVRAV